MKKGIVIAGNLIIDYVKSIDYAMRFANAAAGCCLLSEDSVSGMKSKEEIEDFQRHFKIRRKK